LNLIKYLKVALLKSILLTLTGVFFFLVAFSQDDKHPGSAHVVISPSDSIYASRLPVLELPAEYRGRVLPVSIDNSTLSCWPGVMDQYSYYTCQQYAGVVYVFGYEINRLRNQVGWYWENRYPAHYTWNFLNMGGQHYGVNFFQSFEFIREQGHMTQPDFGDNTALGTLGWINGYDKYFRGMSNRLKKVSAIRINNVEGIMTLKNYLNDHLDGSPTGGIACFTTSGQTLYNLPRLPAGTPEAGKEVVLSWIADPTHGLTIVGYNDSIRFDRNGDGLFTNDLDINSDGIVDARDWEWGAFKFANSYGGWWSDQGMCYVLYSAMANNYGAGGVWNNSVFVMDADTSYHPLLTMKVGLEFNQRDKIRILAGVSLDTSSEFPDHTMEFPMFNHSGGSYPMQGYDSIPGADTLEFGLDITPLLSFIDPDNPARFFLLVEEQDNDGLANGNVHQVSFNHYGGNFETWISSQKNVTVKRNNVTTLSAIAVPQFSKVQISTPRLPAYEPGQPYSTTLQATDGHSPYCWSLLETYQKSPCGDTLPIITAQKLEPINYLKPYAVVALPFSFSFYGKKSDSLYVNFHGFISPDQPYLPLPYVTDELSMMKQVKIISPAFSMAYEYIDGNGDGLWYEGSPSSAVFRWKASLDGQDTASATNFGLRLFPDGRFEFLYGDIRNPGKKHPVFSGISKGDQQNHMLTPVWNFSELNQKSYLFEAFPQPAGLSVNEQGLLTLSQTDTSRILDLSVKVTDAEHISDERTFQISDGLLLDCRIVSDSGNQLVYGRNTSMNVFLTNQGTQTLRDLEIKLRIDNPFMEISDSLAFLAQLNPGQSVTLENIFAFKLEEPLPDKCNIPFLLHVQTPQSSREKIVNISVSAPELLISEPVIRDGDDNLLHPGEVGELIIPLKNSGSEDAFNLSASLRIMDTCLQILSDSVFEIDRLSKSASKELIFLLKASRYTIPGKKVNLQFSLHGDSGLSREYNFVIPVGKRPLALVKLATITSSADSMGMILDSLKMPYDVLPALPPQLLDYECLFVLLGASTQGAHTITEAEGTAMAAYLYQGGQIYLEGYSNWNYSANPVIQPMFKYTTSRVPIYYYHSMLGVAQTLGDSLFFAYSNNLHYAIYSFEPVDEGFTTMTDGSDPPRSLEISYDGEDYKTIGTMLEFGSLRDTLGAKLKPILMQRYLDFFNLNRSGLFAYFHTDKTSLCVHSPASFTDDSYDHVDSWRWEFPGGEPALSSEKDPAVTYSDPGLYDVKLTVSDGVHSRVLLKKDYIRVNQCEGTEDPPDLFNFKIYPNPARGLVHLEANHELRGLDLGVFDLSGRMLIRKTIGSETESRHFILDISALKRGIYFLRMQTTGIVRTVKLIVN